jgi:hypothetical protein
MFSKVFLAIIGLFLATALSTAGTVTLTGTCSQAIINKTNNYATFSLSNSGNQTASNLLIIPQIKGVISLNQSESISYLSPNQNQTQKFYFSNFSAPGSYAEAFVVEYGQGSNTFYALFPCLLNFGNSSKSTVAIEKVTQASNMLTISVLDLSQSPINISVSTLLPPAFTASPSVQNSLVSPNSAKNFTFNLSYPQFSGASYTIGIAVSYLQNNIHHATLQPYLITFNPSKPSFLSKYLIFVIVAFGLMIIIGLIIVSLVKDRKKEDA